MNSKIGMRLKGVESLITKYSTRYQVDESVYNVNGYEFVKNIKEQDVLDWLCQNMWLSDAPICSRGRRMSVVLQSYHAPYDCGLGHFCVYRNKKTAYRNIVESGKYIVYNDLFSKDCTHGIAIRWVINKDKDIESSIPFVEFLLLHYRWFSFDENKCEDELFKDAQYDMVKFSMYNAVEVKQ